MAKMTGKGHVAITSIATSATTLRSAINACQAIGLRVANGEKFNSGMRYYVRTPNNEILGYLETTT